MQFSRVVTVARHVWGSNACCNACQTREAPVQHFEWTAPPSAATANDESLAVYRQCSRAIPSPRRLKLLLPLPLRALLPLVLVRLLLNEL